MAIDRIDPVAVVDTDVVAIDTVPPCVHDGARVRSIDGGATTWPEVDAEVEGCAAATERVGTVAEAAGDATGGGPSPPRGTDLARAELSTRSGARAHASQIVGLRCSAALGQHDQLRLELILVGLLCFVGGFGLLCRFLRNQERSLSRSLELFTNAARDVGLVGERLRRLLILQCRRVHPSSLFGEFIGHAVVVQQVVGLRGVDKQVGGEVAVARTVHACDQLRRASHRRGGGRCSFVRLRLKRVRLESSLLERLIGLLEDHALGLSFGLGASDLGLERGDQGLNFGDLRLGCRLALAGGGDIRPRRVGRCTRGPRWAVDTRREHPHEYESDNGCDGSQPRARAGRQPRHAATHAAHWIPRIA